MNYKIPAILLGGDSVNTLAMTRNLGINNINVICISSNKNEVAYSKYCNKFYVVPDIERSQEIFKNFLLNIDELMRTEAVLFPCSDILNIRLSHIENDLDNLIFLTNKNITNILVNKRNFYMSLNKYKVPHPKTYYPNNYDDIIEIYNDIKYPLIIKPSIPQFFSRFNRKFLIVRSQEELEKKFNIVTKYNIEFIIQELIPGPPTNQFGIAGYFDHNSDPKGIFAYKRIREWPIGSGNGSLIESIPLSEVCYIKDIIISYLKKIKYKGLFDAEFKKDSHNGDFILFEINARSWWQNLFPTVCGINLVLMYYLDSIGEKIEYKDTYKTGVRWIFFLNDVFSLVGMLKKGEIVLSEWFQSYRNIKDYAYFNANDILPFIINPLIKGPIYFRSLLRKFI